MSELIRYNIEAQSGDVWAEECADGDYVLFDDVKAALASQEPVAYMKVTANGSTYFNVRDMKQPDFFPLYTSPQAYLTERVKELEAKIKKVCYYALNRFIHDHDTGKKIFTNDDVEKYTVEALKQIGGE
jgi:hypothetical protein